jgi:hypothetical protein
MSANGINTKTVVETKTFNGDSFILVGTNKSDKPLKVKKTDIDKFYIPAPSNPQNGDTVVFQNGEWVSGQSGSGGDFERVVVNFSSTELINQAGGGIEILPPIGEGKYFDVLKVRAEFTHNSTPYVVIPEAKFWIVATNDFSSLVEIDKNLFLYGEDTAGVFYPSPNSDGTGANIQLFNSSLIFITGGGLDVLTEGDGTLRLIMDYRVLTFGA